MSNQPLFPATKEGLLRHAEYLYLLEVLNKFPEDKILAYVADSYDYFGFLTSILPLAKDIIKSRTGGKLVIRGDSGDPVEIICGVVVPDFSTEATLESAAYEAFIRNFDPEVKIELVSTLFSYKGKNYKSNYNVNFDSYDLFKNWSCRTIEEYELTPEEKGTIQILDEIFGSTTNELGYKVLDECIGMIYGDGITMDRAIEIFTRLKNKGYASLNVVFGIGAYSLAAMLSRDDLGIAVKATAATVVVGDELRTVPVYKQPKTDTSKKSAKGFLKVNYDEKSGLYSLTDNISYDESCTGELETVFVDGVFKKEVTFEEVRERLYS